jgi:hypothetical protein
LFEESAKRNAQRVANEIVNILTVQIGLPIMAGKQCPGEPIQDGFKRVSRRRPPNRAILPNAMGDVARSSQFRNDAIKTPTRFGVRPLLFR